MHLFQMAWMHLIASSKKMDGKVWKMMEDSANSVGDILLMLHSVSWLQFSLGYDVEDFWDLNYI